MSHINDFKSPSDKSKHNPFNRNKKKTKNNNNKIVEKKNHILAAPLALQGSMVPNMLDAMKGQDRYPRS